MKICALDIETSGLLGDNLNYNTLPYRFKPDFKLWCICFTDCETYETTTLKLEECTRDNIQKILADCEILVAHNGIKFDFPTLKLLSLLDYTIGYPGSSSQLFGRDCKILDTLIISKLLNSDLNDEHGRHSLGSWAKRFGDSKIHHTDYSKYSEEMRLYCEKDTQLLAKLYWHLTDELAETKGAFNRSIAMEHKLWDILLKQEVFGFYFDKIQAGKNLEFLDNEMAQIRNLINPLLPPRKLNKGEASVYEWPKNLFLKNGQLSKIAHKFAENIGGKIVEELFKEPYLEFRGEKYLLTEKKPLEVTKPSDIDDLDALKAFLISDLLWQPSEFSQRDILKKPDKTKKTQEEISETIERYIKQTFDGVFAKERCEILEIECTPEALRGFLLQKTKKGKSVFVPTTPKIAIGLEKKICPGIEKLGEKAEFVKDLVRYLTFKHRRNSILGGNIEYDPEEDLEAEKGFLAYVREDGRIATECDPLGCNTARAKHKKVVNIPRVTSLFGYEMRSLFCPGKLGKTQLQQLAMDFASLEARIQSHHCIIYKDGKSLAKTLMAVKPDDIHSVLGRKIGIPRPLAKSIMYALIFGASINKVKKMVGCSIERAEEIYNEFWEAVPALKELKEKVEQHWNENGKKWITGLDGRRLVTRSKHSLINVVFQSGGAIFVKWSIVRICQIMETLGILGDPFIDDEFVIKLFQMMVNHDEIQWASHPKLLKIKVFKDDEEANQNLVPGCSAIGHGSKGPYVAYPTLPVKCIEDGIKIAEEELNLRIEMGFEWNTGANWGMTH